MSEGSRSLGQREKTRRLTHLASPGCLTIPQAAAYLNATKWAIKSMIWSRELPIVPLDKRYMLDVSDLDEVVTKRKRLVILASTEKFWHPVGPGGKLWTK
jgi:hypothetical protein